MAVSAVGFLFLDKLSKNKDYTCVIHKLKPNGSYNRKIITSPLAKNVKFDVVSSEVAKSDMLNSLYKMKINKPSSKFVGATLKDGICETEISSLISDKLFRVKIKDVNGHERVKLSGKNAIQKLLNQKLCIRA